MIHHKKLANHNLYYFFLSLNVLFKFDAISFLAAAQRHALTMLWLVVVLVVVVVVQTFAFFDIGTSFIGIL